MLFAALRHLPSAYDQTEKSQARLCVWKADSRDAWDMGRQNKDGVDEKSLQGAKIAVFGGPRQKFKKAEIDAVCFIVNIFPACVRGVYRP